MYIRTHTCKFLYNTHPYNTGLDMILFEDGSPKCIDYSEKI